MAERRSVRRRVRVRRPGLNLDLALNAEVASGRGATASSRSQNVITQGRRQSKEVTQMEKKDDLRDQQQESVSDEELENQQGEELPDREAMSLVNANAALPVNAAVALNVLSDNSTATADATQSNEITQQN